MPNNTTCPPNEYLTTGQAASFLRISPGTLQNWRVSGTGPVFTKHRRNVYYHRSELEKYMKENFVKYTSTAEWKDRSQQTSKN